MFKELCALLLALPFILALQLNAPNGPVVSSSMLTVTWTRATGTEVDLCDLYLVNDVAQTSNQIASNVTTSSLSVTVVLPNVPARGGYSLRATNVGNTGSVLSQTTTFDISEPVSSSSLSNSSTSGISASSMSGSSLSTSGISSTTFRSSIPGTGTSTKTSATGSPTVAFNGNNGALGMTGIGATVVGLLIAAGTFWAL